MNIHKASNWIKEELDIVEYLSTQYGLSFKKYGKNYRAVCPLHGDTDPSLSITQGQNIFYCFGCKKGGTLVTFVEEMEGINRLQAIQKILSNVDKSEIDFTSWLDDGLNPIIQTAINPAGEFILQKAIEYFTDRSRFSQGFLDFFDKKNLPLDTVIKIYKVGYCDSTSGLVNFLLSAGYDSLTIGKFGLDSAYDNTIVYPVFNYNGEVLYFIRRYLEREGTDMPKYCNSDQSIPTFVEDLMTGVDKLKSSSDILIVEGYNDYLALKIRANANVLAMNGLKLSTQNIKTIISYEVNNIYLWVDGDGGGFKFLSSVAEKYMEYFGKYPQVNVYAIFVEKFDPDELVHRVDELKQNALLLPMWYIGNHFAGSGDKIRNVSMAIQFLSSGFNSLALDQSLEYLADLYNLSVEMVSDYYNECNRVEYMDADAERYVLSFAFSNSKIIDVYNLDETYFGLSIHRKIFNYIKQGFTKVTLRSVGSEANNEWLWETIDKLPPVSFNESELLSDYIEVITAYRDKRKVQDIIRQTQKYKLGFEDFAENVNEESIKHSSGKKFEVVTAKDAVKNIIQKLITSENLMGYNLGSLWQRTNNALLGINNGKLIILSGNTGHGKTNVALNWCYWLSFQQKFKGLYFSGEMDAEEITKRLIAMHTGLSGTSVASGNLNDKDMEKIFDMSMNFDLDNFMIDETMAFNQILNRIKFMKRRFNIDYVVIDYLQLIEPSMGGSFKNIKDVSRTMQLKEMTRRLKQDICKDLKMPVILLAQLGDQALDDYLPQVRRLSESKLVQQDADVTIAIKRKDEKEMTLDPVGNMIMHIDKVRYNESKVVIPLDFNSTCLMIKEATL
jgi:DNA primase catalytic core